MSEPVKTMVSFNVDPQWCGVLFSISCRHEKASLAGGFPYPDALCAFHGPQLDADWLALAGSLGFQLCRLSDTWALVFESVKAAGFVILLGLGTYGVVKLVNYFSKPRPPSPPPVPPQQPIFIRLANVRDIGADGDVRLNDFEACYFGPAETNDDAGELGDRSASTTNSEDSGGEDDCQWHAARPPRSWQQRRCWSWRHRGTNSQSSSLAGRRRHTQADWLLHRLGAVTGRNTYTPANTEELAILNGGEACVVPRIVRENSVDSNVSEMSISDLSMQEHGTETLTYLESLQSEVNTLIDNCEKIDEDFELVKSSRITPGMAALLKCSQANDSGQDSPTTSARAKACFTGLYSLTYSPSLDFPSDDKTPAPADSSLELDSSLQSENQSLPLSSTQTDSTLAGSEDEVMSKLEWDLLDMEPVKEEETEIDSSCMSFSEQDTPEREELLLDASLLPVIKQRVAVLEYALQEWPDQPCKALNMLAGYNTIWEELKCGYVRTVRADHNSAVRAVIFQVLRTGLPLPSGAETLQALVEALDAGCSWLQNWALSGHLHDGNALHGMQLCLTALDELVAHLGSLSCVEEREDVLANILNTQPNLELQLMEAVKLLMLRSAIQLQQQLVKQESQLPEFAANMLAPHTLLEKQMGHTCGLEQAELQLLGYSLGVTLKLVQPSAANTHHFIRKLPEWKLETWPEVLLLTQDDQVFSVLI